MDKSTAIESKINGVDMRERAASVRDYVVYYELGQILHLTVFSEDVDDGPASVRDLLVRNAFNTVKEENAGEFAYVHHKDAKAFVMATKDPKYACKVVLAFVKWDYTQEAGDG